MTSESDAFPLADREFAGLTFHYRSGSVDEQVLDEHYHSRRFFAESYRPGSAHVIVDAGAHIGVFTALAAQRVPAGHVYAIEPAQENFDILTRNIDGNGLGHVTAHKVALSAGGGSIRLYHGPQSWGHTLTPPPPSAGATYEDVPTQTLQEFMSEQDIDVIDYLKMNIEGAEYDVLRQAPDEILQRIGFLLIELHPIDDSVSDALIERLQALGFVTDFVSSGGDPTFKGWLNARNERF